MLAKRDGAVNSCMIPTVSVTSVVWKRELNVHKSVLRILDHTTKTKQIKVLALNYITHGYSTMFLSLAHERRFRFGSGLFLN